MKILTQIILMTTLTLIPSFASAKDIAVCGASEGYGYYPFKGLNQQRKFWERLWQKDKISNGRIILKTLDNNQLDVVIADSSGSIFSSKDDGGEIVLLYSDQKTVSVLVYYSSTGNVENYVFQELKNGKSEVMWMQSKPEGLIPKMATFIAECNFLDIQ